MVESSYTYWTYNKIVRKILIILIRANYTIIFGEHIACQILTISFMWRKVSIINGDKRLKRNHMQKVIFMDISEALLKIEVVLLILVNIEWDRVTVYM